jgi:hypothetical protein
VRRGVIEDRPRRVEREAAQRPFVDELAGKVARTGARILKI